METEEIRQKLQEVNEDIRVKIERAPIHAFYVGVGIGAALMYLLLKGILIPLVLLLGAVVAGVWGYNQYLKNSHIVASQDRSTNGRSANEQEPLQ